MMKKQKVKGFTLIELMVVVAIIAILAAIAIPMIFQYRLSANRAKCIGNMKQIQNMIESRKAAKNGATVEVGWSANTLYVNTNGKGYFKEKPFCPENSTTEYSLANANQPTWIPTCASADDPYNHKLD